MKLKYYPPVITSFLINMEETIAAGSKATFGGEANGQPDIEDFESEEKDFFIDF